MVKARDFQEVVVAIDGHVPEGAVFVYDVVGRGIVRTTIVGIHPIASLVLKDQTADVQIGRIAELNGIVATFQDGLLAGCIPDVNPLVSCSLQVGDKLSAAVLPSWK